MVKRALEGLDGVAGATVSFRTREARVAFDPARASVEGLIATVERLGFRASLKKGPGP